MITGLAEVVFGKNSLWPASANLRVKTMSVQRQRVSFSFLSLLIAICITCISDPVLGQAMDSVVDWRTSKLTDKFFAEGVAVGDFNGDGNPDIAAGPFWYEGPNFSAAENAHRFYHQDAFDPHGYSNNFLCAVHDFNEDGWDDILVFNWPGQDASWYQNPQGTERYWPKHVVAGVVDNESPTLTDLTGDGIPEIICSQNGYFGFYEVNREAPQAKWNFRRISDQSAGGKYTHGLGVGDVNGDGRADLLEKSGWWEQPKSLVGDPQWKKHPVEFGDGSGPSQMFAYDVDGDGDSDVICSQNAHGFGLAWFENRMVDGSVTLVKRPIMGASPNDNPYGACFSQLHALEIADIDGDGLKDIVTGKRHWAHGPKGDSQPNHDSVLYWFRLRRISKRDANPESESVEFIPHRIDDDSGVGTQLGVADLNGDKAADVFVSNKNGTFIHLQHRKTDQITAKRYMPRHRDLRARPTNIGLPDNDGLQPERAAAAMTVPDGFRVQLAAAEPMVHQPIAMTFDHRGRLWVAEGHTYPQRAKEGEGKDKIIILSDNDSDGVFDDRKVFADGLNLVSGLEVGFGGVWIGAAPYLLFIPDKDADDIPDGPPQRLLDGFGYEDTHETLNAFIWGPDGWLYGCHGVFTHSNVGKPGCAKEDREPMNAAVWRYHPTRHQFEVFMHGTSNPWGVDFNDHGQAFISACVIPHLYHVVQGGRYQRQAGNHFNPHTYDDITTIADHSHFAGDIGDHAWWGRDEPADHRDTLAAGGGQAHCGAMIYLGDNWPRTYRNSIFMSNIHGNRINNDRLQRVGSGFVGSHGSDFMFANDRWFRGINMKYASDGTVYVIDWYDKNACHRTKSEIWDRTNGRIYRISFGDTNSDSVDLSSKSDSELAALVDHENDWYCRMARRLLQERHQDEPSKTSGPTPAMLRKLIHNAQGNIRSRLRALWVAHCCNWLEQDDLLKLFDAKGHKAEYLRAWAVQLDLEDNAPTDLPKLERMAASDRSPVVRLYLASALQRIPLSNRFDLATRLVQHGDDDQDHNIPHMLWYGIEPLVPSDPERALQLALKSRIPKIRDFIYRRAASDPNSRQVLLEQLSSEKDDLQRKIILKAVNDSIASLKDVPMPTIWPALYSQLAASEDAEVQELSRRITVKFGDTSIFPALRQIVEDEDSSISARSSALSTLLEAKDKELVPILRSLINRPNTDFTLRRLAIRGVANFSDAESGAVIISNFQRLSADGKADAIATLVSRIEYARLLLDAIEDQTIAQTDVSAFHVRQLTNLNSESIVERTNQVWGTFRKSPEEKLRRIESLKAQLSAEILADARPELGRITYENACGKCHKLFGVGGDIGPDITGSNRGNLDYVLQNMVDPSALVGKDYQASTISLDDGRVVSGLIIEENESAIVVQTANEKVVVAKSEIESRELSAVSMMPEGQLEGMTSEQIRDLVAYLASPRQVPRPEEVPEIDEHSGRANGVIEAEKLRVVEKSKGVVAVQQMGTWNDHKWSEGAQLWWHSASKGEHLTLDLPVAKTGNFEVFAKLTEADDYGIVSIAINDRVAAESIDLYGQAVKPTGPVSLGTHRLDSSGAVLKVTLRGRNKNAKPGFMFGIDFIYLRKVD